MSRGPADGARRGPPRGVRGGIKLGHTFQDLVALPWARPWAEVAQRLCDRSALAQGIEEAERGRTTALDVAPGCVTAEVQGDRPSPYRVRLVLPLWGEGEWEIVVEALLSRAGVSAALLAGQVPEALAELLRDRALQFAPSPAEAWQRHCDCGGEHCPHIIATLLLTGERLAELPHEQFILRGRSVDQVLDHVRRQQAIAIRGRAAAHPAPRTALEIGPQEPLEAQAVGFWSLLRSPDTDPPEPLRDQVSHSLLRRMGPSPLGGKFPIVGLLASVYDAVSESVRRQVDGIEHVDQGDADASTDSETSSDDGA